MSDRNKLTEECCILDGPQSVVPQAIDNRPGLSAIAYRVGTHAGFREAMKARLSRQAALGKLTTRKEDDFTVALLDAWAATADVLTFYQERYANESYLRTATERLSLQQLARLIGYELNPGVAAGTCLAFRVDEPPALPPGSELGESIAQAYRQAMPQQIRIGSGTKVQSVPGQDELPQVFETVEPIDARAEWNELRPELCRDEIPGMGAKHVYLKGTATGLNPGDALLLIGQEREADPGSERWDFRRVDAVDPDPKADRTKVSWLEGLGWKRHYWTVRPAEKEFQVYALRQRVALFGHNAPVWPVMAKSMPVSGPASGLFGEYFDGTDLHSNDRIFARVDSNVKFSWTEEQTPHPAIKAPYSIRWTGRVKPPATGMYRFHTLSGDGVRLFLNGEKILENWTDHFSTPDTSTDVRLEAGALYSIVLEYYNGGGPGAIELSWEGPGMAKQIIAPVFLLSCSTDEWPGLSITEVGTRRGLLAEYFRDTKLSDRRAVQIDHQVDFAQGVGAGVFSARWTGLLKPPVSGNYTFLVRSDGDVRLWVTDENHSKPIIPDWKGSADQRNAAFHVEAGKAYGLRLEWQSKSGAEKISLRWSGPGARPEEVIPEQYLSPPDIHLDAIYPAVTPGSWIVLSIPEYQEAYRVESAVEDSRSNFAMSSKTMRLTLGGENLDRFDRKIRETVVFARQECLERAPTPVSDDIFGNRVTLDRGIPDLPPGRVLVVSGRRQDSDDTLSEIAILDRCMPEPGGATTLLLQATLKRRYRRETVRIYANAARATHGETVTEVLGSGDGSKPFQRFTLSQPPLTRVSASTPSGSESTLEVRVTDVRWREVPSHFGSGPDDRTYTTRQDQDGKTVLHFGDGKTGARLPTGRENVRATYRKGLGLEGNVGAGKLSVLMTRLLGVRDVTNPIKAAGAEDPESLGQARRNAPLTVLTMDRVVSLRDYEDYARAFAGIAKARADWFWTGVHRVVCITVAGPRGEAVASETYGNLLIGIGKAADPCASFRVLDFRPVTFMLKASLKTDPDYRADAVRDSVKSALGSHFSFDAREFGQAVSLAEVVRVIQSVPGVVAVDVDELKDSRGRSGLHEPLAAGGPTVGQGSEPAGAELLTLDEKKVVLKEMT